MIPQQAIKECSRITTLYIQLKKQTIINRYTVYFFTYYNKQLFFHKLAHLPIKIA